MDLIESQYKKISQMYLNNSNSNSNNKNISLDSIILSLSLSFIFLIIFTFIFFNTLLSIIGSIFVFLFLFLIKKIYAIIFIIIYIISIIIIYKRRYLYKGNPIFETDIIQNRKSYNCKNAPLIINNQKLPQNSNNGNYTYYFWIYLDGNDWNSYRYNEWKSIFYTGTPINDGNLESLIQYPGFWLTPKLNNMVIVFQNEGNVERIEIDNIQFNEWINYTVVIESKSISIYINGLLDRTLNLEKNFNVMNNYSIYIASDFSTNLKNNSGFSGELAELICYNTALDSTYIFNSYLYYKKILEFYQRKIDFKKENYNIPSLITNSDYL